MKKTREAAPAARHFAFPIVELVLGGEDQGRIRNRLEPHMLCMLYQILKHVG